MGFRLFSMWSIFLISEHYFLEQIHRDQIKINQSVVGKLVSIYPEKELEIVKTVINKNDEEYAKAGNKTLLKYGYDINTRAFEDDIFKGSLYRFIVYTIFAALIMMSLNIILFLRGSKYFGQRLESFSRNIDKVMDGDYSVNICSSEEGILSKISVQFEQMVGRLKISFESLEKEKENIKSLITDISHQLKTPLASIKMFNSLLLEEDVESYEKIEFLNRSRADINKLEWLTGSLVKLSRLEAGMINLKKERGDIKETIFQASEGSGVGLYLTRKILEEQGGCITVESHKEIGTTFSLFLQNCYQS